MQKIQQQATIQSQRTIITPKLKPLEIQDLQTAIPVPFKLENQCLVLERSLRSWKFQDPIKVPVEQVRSIGDKQLVRYIIEAFASIRPKLIPFVIENKSLLRVARHFLYRCSGSPKSLYNYAESTSLYSRYLGHSPDMIINDVLVTDGNIPDPVKVLNHVG